MSIFLGPLVKLLHCLSSSNRHENLVLATFIFATSKRNIIDSLTVKMFNFIYVVPSICFQTFFVQAFKIVVDPWKFTMLLLYILWGDRLIFMISDSNQQLQLELEYTLLKPDCHSWWISKMQSGREDTLEEWYAIFFLF